MGKPSGRSSESECHTYLRWVKDYNGIEILTVRRKFNNKYINETNFNLLDRVSMTKRVF